MEREWSYKKYDTLQDVERGARLPPALQASVVLPASSGEFCRLDCGEQAQRAVHEGDVR